jgi:(p)ppGpp synthase/HD superfamily hydrolase
MQVTEQFVSALDYAVRLHGGQTRKGTDIPYISHLLAVAALVMESGGDQDEAIAALLHDAVEDCGGRPVLNEIRSRFGGHVADIVNGCTDAYTEPKSPWKARKEQYLSHLEGASESILLVSNADKLHNARAILADYREIGEQLWERFNAERDETLWYYRELSVLFARRRPSRLSEELEGVIAELMEICRRGGA